MAFGDDEPDGAAFNPKRPMPLVGGAGGAGVGDDAPRMWLAERLVEEAFWLGRLTCAQNEPCGCGDALCRDGVLRPSLPLLTTCRHTSPNGVIAAVVPPEATEGEDSKEAEGRHAGGRAGGVTRAVGDLAAV